MTKVVDLTDAPWSEEAERSVLGRMLTNPRAIEEVAGDLLVPEDFYRHTHRTLFEKIVEHHIAGEPTDALSIAEATAPVLKRAPGEWVRELEQIAARGGAAGQGRAADHANIVRRYGDQRRLLMVTYEAQAAIAEGTATPEEVAGILTQSAMEIATSTLRHHETVSYGDIGRAFARRQRQLMAATAAGYELGVKFGIAAVDDFVKGLKPSELWIIGGEAGAGKSAVSWVLGKNYASRQQDQQERKVTAERVGWEALSEDERRAYLEERMPEAPEEERAIVWQDGPKVADERMGTLICSLEMGQEPSEDRLAQELTGVDSGKLREGTLTEPELNKIIAAWKPKQHLPLYFNFASSMRASQLRAYISDEIRRHSIGLVIIDHFRYFELDKPPDNPNKEDEEKAKFLKTKIAEDLNVAVIVLAHTTKEIETRDKRPLLKHLAGSGQIAAHADFVAFVHRPYKHASKKQIEDGTVKATEAELIFRKNRHNLEGISPIFLDLSRMRLSDPDGHENNEQIPF